MRKGIVRYMAKTTGSRRLQENAYKIIQDNGDALTTREICERMNEMKGTKTYNTYTINQVAQCLKKSKFFEKVGEEKMKSLGYGGSTTVFVYDIVDVKEQIAKMLSYKHTILSPQALPKFAKEEWVRQGGVL